MFKDLAQHFIISNLLKHFVSFIFSIFLCWNTAHCAYGRRHLSCWCILKRCWPTTLPAAPHTRIIYILYVYLHLFVDIFKNFIKNIFRFTHLLWYHQIGIFLLLLANTIQSAAWRAYTAAAAERPSSVVLDWMGFSLALATYTYTCIHMFVFIEN